MHRLLLVALLLAAAAVPALAQRAGVTVYAGTLGPGADLTVPLGRSFNVRLGGSYLPYSHADVYTDEVEVAYAADVQLASGRLVADWHPLGSIVRLSAGAVLNRTRADVVAEAVSDYTFEGRTFSPDRIGTLSGSLRYKQAVSPYIGLGLGNAARGRRVGLSLDVGALYTSTLAVEMSGTGLIAPTADQAGNLEEGLASFRFYPVVSLGLGVRL